MGTFQFTDHHLEVIRDWPHLIGHMVGYNKLTPMHSKWIKDVWLHKIPLQAHRGSYKTTSITIIGSIWWLLFHRNARIGIYRKPYTEAANTVRTIKKLFLTDPIQALFHHAYGFAPGFRHKREESVEFNFKQTLTNEGSLNAYSIDKPKTGSHLDEAVCDDFVTIEDRVSPASRKATDRGLMEVNANIVDRGGIPGFVGTPWHKDDSWRIVPGEIAKYDYNYTGLITPKELEYIKSVTTSSLFACNYELKHISDDDAIFRDPLYDRWDHTIPQVYGHLDAKYGGKHTNGLTFMAKRKDGRIQAIGFTSSKHVDEELSRFGELYRKYRVKRIYNEENADKGYLARDMGEKEKMNVETYHEKMSKHIKIVSFLKPYWNNILWDLNTDPEYMTQVLDYREKEEPDDCPDSASSLIREVFEKNKANMALYGK